MNSNYYCVIMAGGIGSRFWPLSRENRPKQFLDILNTGRTFIQQTYDRLSSSIPTQNFIVVTSDKYRSIVMEQLPELSPLQVLAEPLRRNTAPCVAYAISHIAAKNPNATVLFAPADHSITNQQEFETTISRAMSFASSNNALMTIGVKPTRPETGYGYIQMAHDVVADDSIHKVKTFTEKPNLEMAKVFVGSGEFFWNAGIFAWSVKSIKDAFERYLPEISAAFKQGDGLYGTDSEQQFINSIYPECRNVSIDYGIMENADNVYVVCGNLGWSDIGTWGSMYALSDKDANGNVGLTNDVHIEDTHGTIVKLPKGKKAIIEGLEDYIVIDSEDTLLICKRNSEQEIRNWVDTLSNKQKKK